MSKIIQNLMLSVMLLAPTAASAKPSAAPSSAPPAAAPAGALPAAAAPGAPGAAPDPSPGVATGSNAPAAATVVTKRLGVGYKIGNGLGFLGADLVIAPIDHLALDLQFNYLSFATETGTATGYGLAPAVQGRLFAGQVSTPYLGLGFVRASMSLDEVSASTNGFFANVGYEWRWASGVGIILGGGVAVLGNVHATDGVTTIDQEGGAHFNLEAGLRYMFL
jgi:hypothetical protein